MFENVPEPLNGGVNRLWSPRAVWGHDVIPAAQSTPGPTIRGMTTRRSRVRLGYLVVVVAMTATLMAGVPASHERADAASAQTAGPESWPRMAPGRFGAVAVGMDVETAFDAGYFRRTPDDKCGQVLRFKKKWLRRGLGSYVYADGVASISADDPRIRTTRGARVGTTLKVLRKKYPKLKGPRRVMWIDGPAWWAHVRRGDRFLTFFMDSKPKPRSKVLYLAVSRDRPGGFGIGC